MIRSLLCMLTVAASLVVAPARAAQDAKLEDVLDGMAAALGGRERLAKLGAVSTKFAMATSGLTGSGESVTTADGRDRTSYDLGGVASGTTVFDGTNGWSRDQNGKVRPLAGSELENERGNVYFATFSHLLPGRRPGTVALKGRDASGSHYVLTITPEGAKPVTVYVDAKTFLIDRQEAPADDRVSTTTVSDWREVDGVKFPFRSVQHVGPPDVATYDLVVTTTEVKTDVPVDAAAFAAPKDGPADFRFAKGASATEIPFELNTNHIFVPVRVNGSEPRWFIFDTGAETTILDAKVVGELGLKASGAVEARGNGEGSMTASFVKGVTLSVPGAEVLNQTVAAIPLEKISGFEGRRIDGIVGYDFTSRFVVEIDYARKRLALYDPKSYAYSGSGTKLPISIVGNVPFVRATVEDDGAPPSEGLLLVDTGSALTLDLNAPFVRATPWAEAAAGRGVDAPYGMGVGGESKSRVGRVDRLKLGPYALERPITGFSFDESGGGASTEAIGAIGGDVLRRFDVVFDYSRGEMILTPNAAFGDPFEYDMLGASFRVDASTDDGFVVWRVVAGSPAATAGLASGDRIVSVDGATTRGMTMSDLRSRLRRDGATVVLGVRRGGRSLELKPVLKRVV